MNIEHLKTYLEIAAEGNFQRAAQRMNVTQSTVSARVGDFGLARSDRVPTQGKPAAVPPDAEGVTTVEVTRNDWSDVAQRQMLWPGLPGRLSSPP